MQTPAILKCPKLFFAKAINTFRQVYIMVNNAGVGKMFAVEQTSDEHWAKITELNLSGVFRFCREAVNHFMPRNEGPSLMFHPSIAHCQSAVWLTPPIPRYLLLNLAIRPMRHFTWPARWVERLPVWLSRWITAASCKLSNYLLDEPALTPVFFTSVSPCPA